jgi:hypothetical protein
MPAGRLCHPGGHRDAPPTSQKSVTAIFKGVRQRLRHSNENENWGGGLIHPSSFIPHPLFSGEAKHPIHVNDRLYPC